MKVDRVPTALYRAFSRKGGLLYVGISMRPDVRMSEHRRSKPWWTEVHRIDLEHFDDRPTALKAEAKAIRNEHPRYNIQLAPSVRTIPERDTRLGWVYHSLRSGFEHNTSLELGYEVNGDSMSDNYLPDEADSYDLWQIWSEGAMRKYQHGKVPISWFVAGDSERSATFNLAPFQPHIKNRWSHLKDFLDELSWPEDSLTKRPVVWTALPVRVKRWGGKRADKGGFITEATGWVAAPFQRNVDIRTLAHAAGLPTP